LGWLVRCQRVKVIQDSGKNVTGGWHAPPASKAIRVGPDIESVNRA
jgi:hypothetical protein